MNSLYRVQLQLQIHLTNRNHIVLCSSASDFARFSHALALPLARSHRCDKRPTHPPAKNTELLPPIFPSFHPDFCKRPILIGGGQSTTKVQGWSDMGLGSDSPTFAPLLQLCFSFAQVCLKRDTTTAPLSLQSVGRLFATFPLLPM